MVRKNHSYLPLLDPTLRRRDCRVAHPFVGPSMKKQLAASLLFFALFVSGCGGGDGSTQTGSFLASSVSAGDFHACARMPDGTVNCWGLNSSGQLGNSSSINALKPVTVESITTATQVSAGGRHSCALLSNGTLRCWGDNSFGQLGNSTTTGSGTPVTVTGISTATLVSAGEAHTCALLSDGTLRCWGLNSFGTLGDGTTSMASSPVTVSGISTATGISAGGNHTCAVLSNGTVRCWGLNSSGQLGNSIFINSSTPVTVTGITTASGVSSGFNHTCSTLSDGTVRCWGDNSAGQLGSFWTFAGITSNFPVQPFVTSAAGVDAGLFHTCARRTDGRILCWGDNSAGQLGNGNFIGFTPPGLGLPPPVTMTINPVQAAGITSATDIGAGFYFSCSRLSDFTVRCWGDNSFGQLGSGTGISMMTPVQVTK